MADLSAPIERSGPGWNTFSAALWLSAAASAGWQPRAPWHVISVRWRSSIARSADIPQAARRHAPGPALHDLLAGGLKALGEIYPSFQDNLIGAGAVPV